MKHIIAATLFLTLVGLGVWQVERLQWKNNLVATMDVRMRQAPLDVQSFTRSADVNFYPAIAKGVFLHDASVYMHAIERGSGFGGYHVLTPLLMEDGKYIIVDRGFIPFSARDGGYGKPEGTVELQGMTREPQHALMQPGNNPKMDEWYWSDIKAIAAQHDALKGKSFMPFILALNAEGDVAHLPRGGQTQIDIPNDHLGYAITWFTLAGALAVIYGLSVRRKDK